MLYAICALIAAGILLGIDIRQRREIKRLNALLTDQSTEHRRKEKAAFRRGWNRAVAKAYPYGIVPERVKCPEEDKIIAAT